MLMAGVFAITEKNMLGINYNQPFVAAAAATKTLRSVVMQRVGGRIVLHTVVGQTDAVPVEITPAARFGQGFLVQHPQKKVALQISPCLHCHWHLRVYLLYSVVCSGNNGLYRYCLGCCGLRRAGWLCTAGYKQMIQSPAIC